MMPMPRLGAAGVVIGAAVFAAQPARAQFLDQYFPQGVPGYETGLGVTVQSRARSEYSTPDVRLGDVVMQPSATESVGYNDNVLATSKGKGSVTVDTQAALAAATDWSRNGLYTSFSVDNQAYPSLPSQNQTNWVASVGGTLDVGRDQLRVAFTHFNLNLSPSAIDTFGLQAPSPYQAEDVRASYRMEFGRISVTPGIDFTSYSFSDGMIAGQSVSQAYLNRYVIQGSVATRYEFAPQRDAVVVVSGYGTDFTQPQAFQPGTNNTGFAVLGGLEYTADGVFRYRALIGFEQRTYTNPVYKGQGAVVGEATVIWTPTGLTTVTGSLSRSIQDSTSSSTVGYTYTSGKVTVDHEYLRNVLLQGYADIQYADYQQGGGNQTIYNAGGSASWLLNRNMRLVGSYDFTVGNVGAGASGNNYRRNIYLLQVKLAL